MKAYEVEMMINRMTNSMNREVTPCSISLTLGDAEPIVQAVQVPNAVLTSEFMQFWGLHGFAEDTMAARIIQVFVKYEHDGRKAVETIFVPVPAWHMLSFRWHSDIEEFVKLNIMAKKNLRFASIMYRKNGEPGEITRAERFHEWWARVRFNSKSYFSYRFLIDWDLPAN